VARGFTAPLGENAANNSLKELLQTAEVTQKHNRMIVTAAFSPSALSGLTAENSSPATQP
jgi:hypothetical protein